MSNKTRFSSIAFLKMALFHGVLAATLGAQTPWAERGAFVFGDSAVDMGNYHALPGFEPPANHPYLTRDGFTRLSNGLMWPERLYGDLKLVSDEGRAGRRINYAFGSAKTDAYLAEEGSWKAGVLSQVEMFAADLSAKRAVLDADSVAFIEAGPNDFFETIGAGGDVQAVGGRVAKNLAAAAERLSQLGVRTILIHEMPDFGYAPLFNEAGLPPQDLAALQQQLRELTEQSRESLKAELTTLNARLEDTNLVTVPFNHLYEAVRNNPAAFGFRDTTHAAWDAETGSFRTKDPNSHLFLDSVHLTARGQEWESRYYRGILEAVDGTFQRQYARLTDGALAASRLVQDGIGQRLSRQNAPTDGAQSDDRWQTLFQGSFERSKGDPFRDAAGWSTRSHAMTGGAEYRFSSGYQVGGGLAYASQRLASGSLDAEMRGVGFWLFGARRVGDLTFQAVLGETSLDWRRLERSVGVPTFAPRATADGRASSAHFHATYDRRVGTVLIQPLLGFESSTVRVDPFSESGARGLDLRVSRIRRESIAPLAGVAIEPGVIHLGSVAIRPYLRARAAYELGDSSTKVEARLLENTAKPVRTSADNGRRLRVMAELGLQAQLPAGLSLGAGYTGAFSGRASEQHAGYLDLSFRF